MRCPACGGTQELQAWRVRRSFAIALLALGIVVSWSILGPASHALLEGVAGHELLRPILLLPALLLLAAAAAWTVRVRRPTCTACGPSAAWLLAPVSADERRPAGLPSSRRQVLRHMLGLIGVGAAAVSAVVVRNRGWLPVGRNIFAPLDRVAPTPRSDWEGATVRNHRRLGRTGVLVSDISLGSANLRSLDVAQLALDRGVTYVDTSPDYAHTGSEELLGRAMAGRREQIFVASKFCTADGHLAPDASVPKIIAAVEGSLRRLRTDRIDLLHIHSCDRLERLLAPSFHEAFDRLKEQGKARFLGVSSHSPNLRAVANAAIDSGRFDVLMLAYHHGMGWELDEILARAAERDVAVVAMKTLKGAKHANLAGFREEAGSYAQAAFRWVLSNPRVSCLVISFSELRQVDEYLYASGTALTQRDQVVLAKYDRLIEGTYCRPHCGACLDTCVAQLPIDDVAALRHVLRGLPGGEGGDAPVRDTQRCGRVALPGMSGPVRGELSARGRDSVPYARGSSAPVASLTSGAACHHRRRALEAGREEPPMSAPDRLNFGIFLAPFHRLGDNPTYSLERDLELVQHLDRLSYDEAWFGEHHSAGYEIIASPEVFLATAAERTRHIRLGTGVSSLPYHHPFMLADRMVLLDHLTRGRAMFGVGPGALPSDAFMMGIDPMRQREMMDEALEAILALFTSDEPITREASWFTLRDARLHMRPFSRPHMEVAVAAQVSPAGPRAAGKHGASLLSLGATTVGGFDVLGQQWGIAEEMAAEHGHTMERRRWRLVGPMHIAATRDQARRDVEFGLPAWVDYFERVAALPLVGEAKDAQDMVDAMNASGLAVIGTPDDAAAQIERLWDKSGGFGSYLFMAHDWADREATLRSYELCARFVLPRFQGTLGRLEASRDWAAENRGTFIGRVVEAIGKAIGDHATDRAARSRKAG